MENMDLEKINKIEAQKPSFREIYKEYKEYMPLLNLTPDEMGSFLELEKSKKVQDAALKVVTAIKGLERAEEKRRKAFVTLREEIVRYQSPFNFDF